MIPTMPISNSPAAPSRAAAAPGRQSPRPRWGKGGRERSPAAPDATPFPDEAPAAEQVGLNVQAVKPRHVLRGVDPAKHHGAHASSFDRFRASGKCR